MRKIRFRAWDEKDKKMYRVVWLTLPTPSINGYILGHYNLSGQIIEKECHEKDLKLMQYTGLRDKNGMEIYESDLLMFDSEGDKCYNGEVFYDSVSAQFRIIKRDKVRNFDEIKNIEIIGNIYEC